MNEHARPLIVLPEGTNPVVVAAVAEVTAKHHDAYDVQTRDMPLVGDDASHPGAVNLLHEGQVAAVIAGKEHTSAEIVGAGIKVLGVEGDKNGRISTYFLMEGPDTASSFFLADCAVVAAPSTEHLLSIARATCSNAEQLGYRPVVAFLGSVGSSETADDSTLYDAVEAFAGQHQWPTVGRVDWREARDETAYQARTGHGYPDGQRPNIFIMPNLDTGNLAYKIAQDPDANNWRQVATKPSAYVLEKDGRQIVVSDSGEVRTPDADQLLLIAEQACHGIEDPVVAFLSFSTEGSSQDPHATKIAAVAERFRQKYPNIETYGEIQWDAATDKEIYEHKTGNVRTKEPNVFIFPNRDSAVIVRQQLQDSDNIRRLAIGPMGQGYKDGMLYMDLSRGAKVADVVRIIEITGQLAVQRMARKQQEPSV